MTGEFIVVFWNITILNLSIRFDVPLERCLQAFYDCEQDAARALSVLRRDEMQKLSGRHDNSDDTSEEEDDDDEEEDVADDDMMSFLAASVQKARAQAAPAPSINTSFLASNVHSTNIAPTMQEISTSIVTRDSILQSMQQVLRQNYSPDDIAAALDSFLTRRQVSIEEVDWRDVAVDLLNQSEMRATYCVICEENVSLLNCLLSNDSYKFHS